MSGMRKMDIADIVGPLEFDPVALEKKYKHERDKRVVPAGQGQYVATVEGKFADYGKDPWVNPGFSRAPLTDHTEVVIAGGGFGGLLAAARLHERGFRDIRIIDDGGDFGGTWYWNRYPGAMCDIEAHIYLPLLEELNHVPRHRYAYAAESLELSRKIGQHYGLYDKACFQTVITGARWIESDRKWLIETNRGDRMTADTFIMACGRQSLPKLPGIEGLGRFKGHAFHSSRWDYKYTGGSETDFRLTGLQDKRVAVIGTGATAIQIVPEVAKWAKEQLVFQRTPSAVYIRGQRETGADDYADMSKPGWQKERRENFQHILNATRQEDDFVQDGWTDLSARMKPLLSTKAMTEGLGRVPSADEKSLVAELADYRVMNLIRSRVDEIVKDQATADALKPYYRWLCKRPCFHDDYLEAFNSPNTRLVDTEGRGVEKFTERGIVVDGKEYEVDCVIFATGFEAGISYIRLTGFDVVGRGGVKLSEHWGSGVRTLHGMTTDKFPNLLLLGGNQHSAGASNAVHLLDEQATHVAYIVSEARQRGLRTVEPTAEAVDGYTDMIRSSPSVKVQMKFYGACTPGYYNGEGKSTKSEDLFFGNRWGGKVMAFYDMLAGWRRQGDLPGMILER
ncbi:flavin-containing monooxygenase [Reyranella sp.]|uniref:flavin-containing monooxygenase n=1 Tax=Reyranella sp. TaxID=1929291 RepID=UPI00378495AF